MSQVPSVNDPHTLNVDLPCKYRIKQGLDSDGTNLKGPLLNFALLIYM